MKRLLVVTLLSLAFTAGPARAQQEVDSTFAPRVAKPAYTRRQPVVMIDAAHNNYFTRDVMYRAFAALLESDGCRVVSAPQRFSRGLLESCDLLVVADALGRPGWDDPQARESAFLASECDAVRDWVRAGGALLLVADPAPFASAMDSLAVRFGIDQGKGQTVDVRQADPESSNPGWVVFSRRRKSLGDHPILRGRNRGERVEQVATFVGQSIVGPPGSAGLLALSAGAADLPIAPDARQHADPAVVRASQVPAEMLARGAVPSLGRFQGVAFAFGRGRVVMLADGAMLGAQRVVGLEARRRGRETLPFGLNRASVDNQQFALNVVHWLTRLLD